MLTCDPHVSLKKQDDPAWYPGDAVGRATPLRGRVVARTHFGAPCILDEPGVDLLVVPQR